MEGNREGGDNGSTNGGTEQRSKNGGGSPADADGSDRKPRTKPDSRCSWFRSDSSACVASRRRRTALLRSSSVFSVAPFVRNRSLRSSPVSLHRSENRFRRNKASPRA